MKSFAEFIAAYRADCLANEQAEATVIGKSGQLEAFAGWCLANGVATPMAVTLSTLEAYRQHLFQHHKRRDGRPIDLTTRRNHLTAVRVFLRRMKRLGYLKTDPGVDFDLPRVRRRLSQTWLTEVEVDQVKRQTDLHGLRGLRDHAMLEALFATGVRRMEVTRLDVRDVDFEAQTLKVRKGKGGHDRVIPIADRALAAIKAYLIVVRPRLAHVRSGDALFLDNRGRRYTPRQAGRLVGRYVALSGVGKRGACNLYRHATATLMHKNGADILHVQKMLGHEDVSTTQIYTHVEIGHLKKVYAETHPAARKAGSNPQEMTA